MGGNESAKRILDSPKGFDWYLWVESCAVDCVVYETTTKRNGGV